MVSTKVTLYFELATLALSRPPQYRAGLECRMRRVWRSMTRDEQTFARASY